MKSFNRLIKSYGGFTLIELVLVSAILGMLASIAIPKFSNLIRKAQEAAIKGKLGSFRSALTIYNADTEGLYPFFFSASPYYAFADWNEFGKFLAPKYIQKFDKSVACFSLPGLPHLPPYEGRMLNEDSAQPPQAVTDNCCLGYITRSPGMTCTPVVSANFIINCTHDDSSGRRWSSW